MKLRAAETVVKESVDTEPPKVTPLRATSTSVASYGELFFEDFAAIHVTSPRVRCAVPIKFEIQKKSADASKVVHSSARKPASELKPDITSLGSGSPAFTLKSSSDGLAMAKRTSNCDAITLAFSTHKNSLFSCIAHACAGLSYAQVSFLAARSLKFSTPASDWKVGRELSRVQVATEYTFDLVSRRTAKEKTKSTLAALSERICAQIDKDQCVISNDDNGHFSLICGYNRHETEDGLRTFFLNQYFGKTPKDAALCYARVEVSTRKLFIFVGKQKYSAAKLSQQFHTWAKDAVETNSFCLSVAYSRQKGMKTLLEGVGGFHRLMQRAESEESPLELSRVFRSLMHFFDAREHSWHWAVCQLPLWTQPLQQSIEPLLAVWHWQLELVKQTVGDFGTFDGSSKSLEVGCDSRTRCRLLQLLRQLTEMEEEVMYHLEAVLRSDSVWLL